MHHQSLVIVWSVVLFTCALIIIIIRMIMAILVRQMRRELLWNYWRGRCEHWTFKEAHHHQAHFEIIVIENKTTATMVSQWSLVTLSNYSCKSKSMWHVGNVLAASFSYFSSSYWSRFILHHSHSHHHIFDTILKILASSLQSPRSLNYFCIDNNPQSLILIGRSYSQTIVTNIPLKIFIIISHRTCNPHDTHHPNHHHIDWYAAHNQQSRSFVMHFEDGTTKSTQVNRHPSHHHNQYWWR